MLKRIEAVQNGKKAEEITELNLDNCESEGAIEGISDEFSSLQRLSLNKSGITSLKGFPKLLKLQKLELNGNGIDGGLSSLSGCVSLQHLNLSGNKLEDIDALSPLSDLKNLTSLDLLECGVTKLSDFREAIFKLLPSLQMLNGCAKEVEKGDQNGTGNGAKTDEVPHVHVANDDEEGSESAGSPVEEESDEESGEEEVGLSYLDRDDISDEEDDGDYEEESEGEDEEIDDEDDEEARGVKRKLEEQEEEEQDS